MFLIIRKFLSSFDLKIHIFNTGHFGFILKGFSPDLINCDSAGQIIACILRSMRRMEALDTRH